MSGSEMVDPAGDGGRLAREPRSPISPPAPRTDQAKPHLLRTMSPEPVVTDVSTLLMYVTDVCY